MGQSASISMNVHNMKTRLNQDTTATVTLDAQTQTAVSPASVGRDTTGMESHVMVKV